MDSLEFENDENLLQSNGFDKIPTNEYWDSEEENNGFDGEAVSIPSKDEEYRSMIEKYSPFEPNVFDMMLEVMWCGRNLFIPVLCFIMGMIFMFSMINSNSESFCSLISTTNIPDEGQSAAPTLNDKSSTILPLFGNEKILSPEKGGAASKKCVSVNDETDQKDEVCSDDELISCFGKKYYEGDVCSGHGICNDFDKCTCSERFSGLNCEDCEALFVGRNCDRERLIFHPAFETQEYSNLRNRVKDLYSYRRPGPNLPEERGENHERVIFVALLDNVAKYNLEYGKFLKKTYETKMSEYREEIEDRNEEHFVELALILIRKEQKFKKYPGEKCLCFGDCQTGEAVKKLLNQVTFGHEGNEGVERRKNIPVKYVFRLNYEKDNFEFTDCENNNVTIVQIRELILS